MVYAEKVDISVLEVRLTGVFASFQSLLSKDYNKKIL